MKLASALAVLALCAPLTAAQPTIATYSYQGRLTDAGSPYTGPADVYVEYYDAPTGGTLLGSDADTVPVTDGLFTVELSINTDGLGPGPVWFEISVRTDPIIDFVTLSPRQAYRPGARSVQAAGAELISTGETVFARAVTSDINGAGLTSPASTRLAETPWQSIVASASGEVQSMFFGCFEPPANPITLRLYQGEGVGGALLLEAPAVGGGGTGNTAANTPDSGVFISAGQTYTLECFTGMPGNPTEPKDSTYRYYSSDAFPGRADFSPSADYEARFITSAIGGPGTYTTPEGDAQVLGQLRVLGDTGAADPVELPAGSVSPDETAQEPGVAVGANDFVIPGTSQTVVVSRSITVPGPGYVVAQFSGRLQMSHGGNGNGLVYQYFSLDGVNPLFDNERRTGLPNSAGLGNYDSSISNTATFAVSAAGTHTYYYLARNAGAMSASINDARLTLMYFPTAYGTVSTD